MTDRPNDNLNWSITMTRPTDIIVYWDAQDPTDEGWAYRVRALDCAGESEVIDSGPVDRGLGDADAADQATGAVVDVAAQYGIALDATDVAYHLDGGFATWSG